MLLITGYPPLKKRSSICTLRSRGRGFRSWRWIWQRYSNPLQQLTSSITRNCSGTRRKGSSRTKLRLFCGGSLPKSTYLRGRSDAVLQEVPPEGGDREEDTALRLPAAAPPGALGVRLRTLQAAPRPLQEVRAQGRSSGSALLPC